MDGLNSRCKECVKTRAKKWYANNLEHGREVRKQWRDENRDYVNQASKEWREQNPERLKEVCKKWYRENQDKVKAARELWKERNPGVITALSAKRYATKTQSTPKWVDTKTVALYYELARMFTLYFGEPFHVDHVVPLRSKLVCGLHWEGNLRVIEGSENLAKSNSFWPDMP